MSARQRQPWCSTPAARAAVNGRAGCPVPPDAARVRSVRSPQSQLSTDGTGHDDRGRRHDEPRSPDAGPSVAPSLFGRSRQPRPGTTNRHRCGVPADRVRRWHVDRARVGSAPGSPPTSRSGPYRRRAAIRHVPKGFQGVLMVLDRLTLVGSAVPGHPGHDRRDEGDHTEDHDRCHRLHSTERGATWTLRGSFTRQLGPFPCVGAPAQPSPGPGVRTGAWPEMRSPPVRDAVDHVGPAPPRSTEPDARACAPRSPRRGRGTRA